MICPKCFNTNNVSGDAFCYKDGTPLVENLTCECGKTSVPVFKFCPRCGKESPYRKSVAEMPARTA
jgi:hypothetical protein